MCWLLGVALSNLASCLCDRKILLMAEWEAPFCGSGASCAESVKVPGSYLSQVIEGHNIGKFWNIV